MEFCGTVILLKQNLHAVYMKVSPGDALMLQFLYLACTEAQEHM